MSQELPIKTVIQIEATNGSTTLMALKELVGKMERYRLPRQGETIEDKFFRLEILEGWAPK